MYQDPFITVVSVGNDEKSHFSANKAGGSSEFITVLTIGDEENKTIKEITEEVIVYRLPGERLGFGLKFEGGTKAREFVKRLFIQSCALDSPASRVQSSWGQLVEGDEVLEIDSIPVNSMTRIDCVRFLKDSNVAIKLLVKHTFKSKYSEDLPVIISTEEKKPPPVPPRKLHRKLHKNLQSDNIHDNIVPTIKYQESFSSKSARLQSPRNSFRKKYSPDVSRRLSDGSLGPPDAEVYLDLIAQESTQSLSESDDTGSTISTVLDRFASFPTTTTSSFAGSLPSTPTSIQKHLDLSYVVNDFPDDDFFPIIDKKLGFIEENNNIVNGTEDNAKCLQELQLPYSNTEDISDVSEDTLKRPVIIPRCKDKPVKHNDNENTLPRLVDFVPKSPQKDLDASVDTLKRFLETERFHFEYDDPETMQDMDYSGIDMYSSKWLLSSHLSTIGEDEEEQSAQDFGFSSLAPKVTVENAETVVTEAHNLNDDGEEGSSKDNNQVSMEIPPSNFRQPPDGHEFPDFIETPTIMSQFTSPECPPTLKSSWNDLSQTKSATWDRSLSSSNYDLRQKVNDAEEEKFSNTPNLLHTRSQSLIDMSVYSKEKGSSRWTSLAEQRRKGLSKLKGLVIPEASENDVTPLVNIPEIRSVTTSQLDLDLEREPCFNGGTVRATPTSITSVELPSLSSHIAIPKYSPAFKRKSLQLYGFRKFDSSDAESSYDEYNESTPSRTSDDPKSLESIASPTRSDYSFEYISSKTIPIKDQHPSSSKDLGDSDNDSAVSSSQSSYNSRCSPPSSPISEDKHNNGQNRMLKPFSVEAINRKNILASAKCRSGKDIKIGSPVIQRKTSLEENETVGSKVVKENEIQVEVVKESSQSHLVQEPVEKPPSSPAVFVPAVRPIPTKRSLPPPLPKQTTEDNKLSRVSASSILQSRNKPVNVQSLKANFENASNSAPLFPKSYKSSPTTTPPELVNGKPPISTRRRSEELRRQSDDKLFFKQMSQEEKPQTRRLSNSSLTKEKPVSPIRKEHVPIRKQQTEINLMPSTELRTTTVELNVDQVGNSLGITLAGGADYESKDITIHRIRYGSIAYQDGRLKKGDKVISINNHLTVGLTHSSATELLKEPCTKFSIVIQELKEFIASSNSSSLGLSRKSTSVSSLASGTKEETSPSSLVDKKPTHTVILIKDGAGLGFSIEGGKDSPKGDVPLVIKKIFVGGAADKCGELKVGDEVLSINSIGFKNLSRIEAWSQMKKISEGTVKIDVFR